MNASSEESFCGRRKESGKFASYTARARELPICWRDTCRDDQWFDEPFDMVQWLDEPFGMVQWLDEPSDMVQWFNETLVWTCSLAAYLLNDSFPMDLWFDKPFGLLQWSDESLRLVCPTLEKVWTFA